MATLCILLGRSFTRNWSEISQESQDICWEAHFGKAWQMILQGFFFFQIVIVSSVFRKYSSALIQDVKWTYIRRRDFGLCTIIELALVIRETSHRFFTMFLVCFGLLPSATKSHDNIVHLSKGYTYIWISLLPLPFFSFIGRLVGLVIKIYE